MEYLAFMALIALSFLDARLTRKILALDGGFEKNPIVRKLIDWFPGRWQYAKTGFFGVAGLIILATFDTVLATIILGLFDGVLVYLLFRNLRNLKRLK